jgi:hypothetical protein
MFYQFNYDHIDDRKVFYIYKYLDEDFISNQFKEGDWKSKMHFCIYLKSDIIYTKL